MDFFGRHTGNETGSSCGAVRNAPMQNRRLAPCRSLGSVHSVLSVENVGDYCLKIVIRIDKLNVATLGPDFLFGNRIRTLPQHSRCIGF